MKTLLCFLLNFLKRKKIKFLMTYNELTPEEERVIIYKSTERPYTGEEYTHNKDRGTYVCRRCNTPLYHSSDKFDFHCGWPVSMMR